MAMEKPSPPMENISEAMDTPNKAMESSICPMGDTYEAMGAVFLAM